MTEPVKQLDRGDLLSLFLERSPVLSKTPRNTDSGTQTNSHDGSLGGRNDDGARLDLDLDVVAFLECGKVAGRQTDEFARRIGLGCPSVFSKDNVGNSGLLERGRCDRVVARLQTRHSRQELGNRHPGALEPVHCVDKRKDFAVGELAVLVSVCETFGDFAEPLLFDGVSGDDGKGFKEASGRHAAEIETVSQDLAWRGRERVGRVVGSGDAERRVETDSSGDEESRVGSVDDFGRVGSIDENVASDRVVSDGEADKTDFLVKAGLAQKGVLLHANFLEPFRQRLESAGLLAVRGSHIVAHRQRLSGLSRAESSPERLDKGTESSFVACRGAFVTEPTGNKRLGTESLQASFDLASSQVVVVLVCARAQTKDGKLGVFEQVRGRLGVGFLKGFVERQSFREEKEGGMKGDERREEKVQ